MVRARDEALIAAFSEVLRAARKTAGQTQEELAHAAGVDRTFVGLLETGKRQPTLSVIFAVAQALECKPEELVKKARILLSASS